MEGTIHLDCASGEFLRAFLLDPVLPPRCQGLLICPVFQKYKHVEQELSSPCDSLLVKVPFALQLLTKAIACYFV